MKKTRRLSAVLLALLLLAAGCSIEPMPEDSDLPTDLPIVLPTATANENYFDVALTVGGIDLTVVEYNLYYNMLFNQHYATLLMGGIDLSKPLREQSAESLTGDADMTVDDLLHELVISYAHRLLSSLQKAESAGFALSQQDLDMIEAEVLENVEKLPGEGLTADEKVAAHFGYGCTVETIITDYRRGMTVQKYYDEIIDAMTYTDAQMEQVYLEIGDALDVVSYRAYSFYGFPEDLSEDATEEEWAAASTLAMSEAKQQADAMLAAISDEASFAAEAGQRDPLLAGDASRVSNVSKTELPDEMGQYLFSADREPYDLTVVRGTYDYTVVMFLSRGRDEAVSSVDVRHILIRYGDERDDEGEVSEANREQTRGKAQEVYDLWLAGEQTEESFAALVPEHSDDEGSLHTGGLYEGMAPGWAVKAFNDWCFDPARQPGDSGIVEAVEFGFHIMYMSALGEPGWVAVVKDKLKERDFNATMEAILEEYPMEVRDFDRSFSDTFIQPIEEDAFG